MEEQRRGPRGRRSALEASAPPGPLCSTGSTKSEAPISTALHAAFWQRADRPGAESFLLDESDGRPRLEGSVVLYADDAPWRIRYEIACDANFVTRAVRVEAQAPGIARTLSLSADAARRWSTSAGDLPALSGCIDVDVSFSPSTNLLPIRRLGLAVGESEDVIAAWILLPDLEVKPLPQRYTRIGERRYRYQSRGGAFSVELDVDEAGLVLDYPPFWKRAKLG